MDIINLIKLIIQIKIKIIPKFNFNKYFNYFFLYIIIKNLNGI